MKQKWIYQRNLLPRLFIFFDAINFIAIFSVHTQFKCSTDSVTPSKKFINQLASSAAEKHEKFCVGNSDKNEEKH